MLFFDLYLSSLIFSSFQNLLLSLLWPLIQYSLSSKNTFAKISNVSEFLISMVSFVFILTGFSTMIMKPPSIHCLLLCAPRFWRKYYFLILLLHAFSPLTRCYPYFYLFCFISFSLGSHLLHVFSYNNWMLMTPKSIISSPDSSLEPENQNLVVPKYYSRVYHLFVSKNFVLHSFKKYF